MDHNRFLSRFLDALSVLATTITIILMYNKADGNSVLTCN